MCLYMAQASHIVIYTGCPGVVICMDYTYSVLSNVWYLEGQDKK
jgi:hypothetical protein